MCIVLRMDYQFNSRSFCFLLSVKDMFLRTLTNFMVVLKIKQP